MHKVHILPDALGPLPLEHVQSGGGGQQDIGPGSIKLYKSLIACADK